MPQTCWPALNQRNGRSLHRIARFVSGHDLSRAVRIQNKLGFSPCLLLWRGYKSPDHLEPELSARLSRTLKQNRAQSTDPIPTFLQAKWRDLLFILPIIESEWTRRPLLCHPERSRGICSAPL